MAGRFEVYGDEAGEYRWQLLAPDGQAVASGDGYETQEAAIDGARAVRRAADGADLYAEAPTEAGPEPDARSATKVNAASKLIKIEETGASLPD